MRSRCEKCHVGPCEAITINYTKPYFCMYDGGLADWVKTVDYDKDPDRTGEPF